MAFIPALLASFLPKIVGGIGDVIESVAEDASQGEIEGLGDLGGSILGGIGKAIGFPGSDQALPIVKKVAKSLSETPQRVSLNNMAVSSPPTAPQGIIRKEVVETQPMYQAAAKTKMQPVYMNQIDPEEELYKEFQAFKRFKTSQKKEAPVKTEVIYEQQL